MSTQTVTYKPFAVNADSAVLYRLQFWMTNTECAKWFKRRPELTPELIANARQLEIAGKIYMGVRCLTTADARRLVAAAKWAAEMANPLAECKHEHLGTTGDPESYTCMDCSETLPRRIAVLARMEVL